MLSEPPPTRNGAGPLYKPGPERLQVEVVEWKRVQYTFSEHTSFRLVTKTDLPLYRNQRFHVYRRYTDFEWLQNVLRSKNRATAQADAVCCGLQSLRKERRDLQSWLPALGYSWVICKAGCPRSAGILVPPLPPKGYSETNEEEFLDVRKRFLQIFLDKVTSHPTLRYSEELMVFLEEDDPDQWSYVRNGGTGILEVLSSVSCSA
ncbi:hypothetical protein CYMTET_41891 [Cymbomonas tetramitiformis]|uniref:PX domain-containing protein n=1 Tax=Cymbomonas tetramitiformis TaxID=36881 RepID=A0AAE0F223_9CHLO|nr:hypothetical protein CYMTET_41891 [Cymbomonas tetramitiformis]